MKSGADKHGSFFSRLWDNWASEDPEGPCEGCPAHWSNRSDIEGNPGSRTSSHGIKPWFGDGHLEDVDIVILGHEPGKPKDDRERRDYTGECFNNVRNPEVTDVPQGAYSIKHTQPLFDTLDDELNVYWSQIKKCNEISDGEKENACAEVQCAGIGDTHQGYLTEELQVTDPDYVISLGKSAYESFTDVFEVDRLGDENFTTELSKGDYKSGLRILEVTGECFSYIPLGHPSHGIHENISKPLDIQSNEDMNKTERYFQLVAEDLLALDNLR